ncbi:MAG: nuclease A inhibitor family protein [Myxococcales bacterium]
MSKLTVKSAIDQALKTPKGSPKVSKAEAEAIAKAAITETSGQPRVTADEAKLLQKLLKGDSFDGGKKYQLTDGARQVLESFAVTQGLPIGTNTAAMKARIEASLAGVELGEPLAKAPSTTNLLKVELSDARPSCGPLREALLNPATGSFFLKTTVQGRGMPKPQVSYFGPFALGAATPGGPKLSAAELGAKVAQAADGYWFTSETDCRLTFLTGPKVGKVDAETVRAAFTAQHDAQVDSMFGTTENVGLAARFVQERDATDFLNRYSTPYDPNDPGMAENCQKFAAVADLLKQNLTDLHVYRFLERDSDSPGTVSVFIAGKTASGELVAVMTGAVET